MSDDTQLPKESAGVGKNNIITEEVRKDNLVTTDIGSIVSFDDSDIENDRKLSRSLNQRHVQMLALIGIFGTGIFLSSGGTLALAGNVGMLIAYVFVGLVVVLNQMANAEVSSFMPLTGFYIKHAEHLIDESLGFGLGWIMVYNTLIPTELSATALVMSYWSDLNPAVWITVFGVLIVLSNSYSVRFYGEFEFFFGILKITLIVGLFLVCLIIDLGGVKGDSRIGFRYWKQSPFNEYYTTGSLGKFLAFWKCVSGVVYSFGGVQFVSMFGGETKYPRRSIFIASKKIAIRVFSLYFCIVWILSMVLSSKDKSIITSTGNSQSSPFVIAIKRANIKVLPHIINAVVLSSAFSAANLSLMQGSRILFALASKKQAPKIFLRTNKRGIPYVGLIVTALFLSLSYMSSSSNSANVFSWFQSITSSNLLIGWIAISMNHIALTRALRAQLYTRSDLPHTFRFGSYAAWLSLFFSVLFLLTGGFSVFLKDNFEASTFVSSYLTIPLVIGLTLFWKFFKKTKYLRPTEVDLAPFFDQIKTNPEPPVPKPSLKNFFIDFFT